MLRSLLFLGICLVAVGTIGAYVAPNSSQPVNPANVAPTATDRADMTADVVAQINQEFEANWDRRGLTPAPAADQWLVIRRLSLALTGTVPSIEDIRKLESLPVGDRIEWWTTSLLKDRRYADYIAERLARAYVGVEEGPFLVYRRRRFVTWLSDQIHANRPYDELVSELITAEGLWTDSPEVNFLTITLDDTQEDGRPNPIRLAGRTTRAFLGVRLDCMQCHDDNLDGTWLQSDFHELAAFFSDPKPTLTGMQDKTHDYEYTYLDEEESTTVEPNVPFAKELLSKDGSRRERLADWVTSDANQAFARSMVNRIWALAYGKPLVDPVDNIPLEGPYPAALETLANDFANHGYDLRRLWMTVASAKPFQLDSRSTRFEITAAHEEAWAAFPITRLRPEQVAGAIVQSAKLATVDADSHVISRFIKSERTNSFVKRYGDVGEDEFNASGGTIPQRLVVLNGEMTKELTEDNMVMNAATRISALAPDDSQAIESTYRAVLSRYPTFEEKEHFLERLAGKKGKQRVKFFEDLYWVLYNSTEFSWNH